MESIGFIRYLLLENSACLPAGRTPSNLSSTMNSCGRIDYAKSGRGRNLRGGASRRPNAKLIVEPRTGPRFVGKKMGRQQPQFRASKRRASAFAKGQYRAL